MSDNNGNQIAIAEIDWNTLPTRGTRSIIKLLRDRYGAPNWAIAADTGLSQSLISAIYLGKTRNFDTATVNAIRGLAWKLAQSHAN